MWNMHSMIFTHFSHLHTPINLTNCTHAEDACNTQYCSACFDGCFLAKRRLIMFKSSICIIWWESESGDATQWLFWILCIFFPIIWANVMFLIHKMNWNNYLFVFIWFYLIFHCIRWFVYLSSILDGEQVPFAVDFSCVQFCFVF